ncbi:MAG: hypothetical protein O2924_02160 [Chloroflexi bacterium]|nr:hypothetical protein [Chloroflexota bacterium]MQC16991.1 hypothetical protein [Chloroflexota bacterium]
MSAQVGSLDYVMLRAPDVAALVEAYRLALDAVPIEESYPAWARIRLGNVDVGIHIDEQGSPGRGAELVFRVHDVGRLKAGLSGTAFEVEDYEAIPGGLRLGFRDPAGNALAAIQWGVRVEDIDPLLSANP